MTEEMIIYNFIDAKINAAYPTKESFAYFKQIPAYMTKEEDDAYRKLESVTRNGREWDNSAMSYVRQMLVCPHFKELMIEKIGNVIENVKAIEGMSYKNKKYSSACVGCSELENKMIEEIANKFNTKSYRVAKAIVWVIIGKEHE